MTLDPRIISAAISQADAFGVDPAKALAFVEVESNGQAFTEVKGRHKALIRYEGHYVWRRLPPDLRQLAQQKGLASPRVGGVRNPRDQETRYQLLYRAVSFFKSHALNPDLAYECVSVGLGQVMGANWQALGYTSAKALVEDASNECFTKDVNDQIHVIFEFLRVNHLLDDLSKGNWASLAAGYNGPAYARNSYDIRLKRAYEKWATKLQVPELRPTLRLRSKGPAVEELQGMLAHLGFYMGRLDGIFGGKTEAAVVIFQGKHALEQDGVVGPHTWIALKDAYSQLK